MIKREELLELGFYELPHFTIDNNMLYDLRNFRRLTIASIGTPNEILFIEEYDSEVYQKINELIVLHNYDYDGYLTLDKLNLLLDFFKRTK